MYALDHKHLTLKVIYGDPQAKSKPREGRYGRLFDKSAAWIHQLIKFLNVLNSRSIPLVKPTPLVELLILKRDQEVVFVGP